MKSNMYGEVYMKYKKLDKEILSSKNRRIISSDEALNNVIPIQWSNEVINGLQKVIIHKVS